MSDEQKAALLRELIGLFSSNVALPVILFIAWWTERKRHWAIADESSNRLQNAIIHYRNVTATNQIINAPRSRPTDLT
jgi:hypothetical protein